ncbi:C-type lectin 6, partial [Aphelenchoides avenae]
YDGSIASDLPWSPDAPLGGSNTVVQISAPGYTVEATEPAITRLVCKAPAAHVPYDGCSGYKAKPTTPSTLTTLTTTAPCPAAWIHCPNSGKCFQWLDGGFNHSDGQARCQAIGGNLATVDSPAATQCLLDMASKNYTDLGRVWIGLVDSERLDIHPKECTCWQWLDGTPYDYNYFPTDGPINQNGLEFCTEAYLQASGLKVGDWNDNDCGVYNAALCSIPANAAA